MAQMVLNIGVDLARPERFIEAIAPALAAWPAARKVDFADRWRAMERAGAEMVTFLPVGTTLHTAISDDFRRLLAEFGVWGPD